MVLGELNGVDKAACQKSDKNYQEIVRRIGVKTTKSLQECRLIAYVLERLLQE